MWEPFLPMKLSFQRSIALCAILLVAAIAPPPAVATSRETIAMSVGRLLEEGHYTRQKLNEDVSKKFLQTYLELLDFSHLFYPERRRQLNANMATRLQATFSSARSNLLTKFMILLKRVDERVAK
jgi:carboxyl-terminal processing protease